MAVLATVAVVVLTATVPVAVFFASVAVAVVAAMVVVAAMAGSVVAAMPMAVAMVVVTRHSAELAHVVSRRAASRYPARRGCR